MAEIKNINQLRQQAQQIKNETEIGGNTAPRVGGLFEGIVDRMGQQEDKFVVLSESAYNLANKDDSKFYFVYEDET